MASISPTAVRRSTKPLMREALLVFGRERRAMPGTLHELPAHIKRAAGCAPGLLGSLSRRAWRRAPAGRARSAFGFLHPEHDEHDDPDDRDEDDQPPPAAPPRVVEPARADGELRQQRRERKDAADRRADVVQHHADDDQEQYEPPEFRPRSDPVKVDVLAETRANRFRESHRLLPRAIW